MDKINSNWILIPQNLKSNWYKGVIFIKDREFRIEFLLEKRASLKNSSFNCDLELKQLLSGYEQILKERLHHCNTPDDFLNEIHCLATRLQSIRDRHSRKAVKAGTLDHQEKVIQEIGDLGWERLMYLSPTFDSLSLVAKDAAGRKHTIYLKFDNKDVSKVPSVQTDLPSLFHPSLTKQDVSLTKIYEQFVLELNKYQDFWDIMDEIDENCWILEPETKLHSCCYRRIAIGNKSSMLVTLDPLKPNSLPECRLLGADHVIMPLREKWNQGNYTWDASQSTLANLKTILQVDFPSPSNLRQEDYNNDCSICYAHRMNDEIPEKSCDDPRCGQVFHASCLVEGCKACENEAIKSTISNTAWQQVSVICDKSAVRRMQSGFVHYPIFVRASMYCLENVLIAQSL